MPDPVECFRGVIPDAVQRVFFCHPGNANGVIRDLLERRRLLRSRVCAASFHAVSRARDDKGGNLTLCRASQ